MATKKHSSKKSAKTGARLSGNPQLRAKQLQERASSYASSQRDSGRETTIPLGSRLPADMAAGRDNWTRPAPWWPPSHERILDQVRTTAWPTDPLAVETLAGQIVGDELFTWVSTHGVTGVYPLEWMTALVDAASAALQAAITADPAETAEGTTEWPKLWAFLTGLLDHSILDALDEAAALLADGTTGATQIENAALAPMAHLQVTGDILIAHDTYGSRVLLTADFTFLFPNDPANSPTHPHCYAWDVDWCVAGTVVGAGAFKDAAEALTWWRAQVGPAAGEAALTTPHPLEFLRLLQPALVIDTLLDPGIIGDEPREVMREYYRLHARAAAIAAHFEGEVDKAWQSPDADEDPDPHEDGEETTEAFLAWYAANIGPDEELSTSEALEIILGAWGPFFSPVDVYYSCSPHRIEATATAIQSDHDPEDAAPALRLLPAWTDWCLTRHQIAPASAARSRAAAISHSALTDPLGGPSPEVTPYHRTE